MQRQQRQNAREEIEKLESRKTHYSDLLKELKKTGLNEISLTDPDCRTMKNNERLEPCYNAQVSVDSKFHLIPEYYVTNEPVDHSQLSKIATRTKEVLGVEMLNVTADAQYFNSQEIKECLENGITPCVPELGKDGIVSSPNVVPKPDFYRSKFHYDTECIERRKELTEHPFGTIKRAFNQSYLLLKSLRKVNGEVGLTLLAYNLRRVINLLGTKALITAIKS